MGEGEYYHVGLIVEILLRLNTLQDLLVDHLIIDIHTDGMSAHHSTNTQIWPIQFRIINIGDDEPAIIGVYVSLRKPSDAMEYLKYLIEEFKSISQAGGLIANAPARALVLNHRGHNATNPCSKCTISGQSYQRTMCFLSTINEPRTYGEYYYATDKNHHLPTGESPLKHLGINMIKFVPFKYMHLICLGVMKKFLTAVIDKKCKMPNLSTTNIKHISDRLLTIEACCPYESSRHPRPLEDCQQYKATDF
ncbi:uncharacterized protein [Chelonus insularis]|uniref:uncharacterized protein n=1 Tax=Chelonus insularis TaxID=460826 RepID=UPI00158B1A2A|nr:uncharacterized protein LOC118070752 [Chelonus insularis]